MIMTSQHFLNHVKQIIGRTFHIIIIFFLYDHHLYTILSTDDSFGGPTEMT